MLSQFPEISSVVHHLSCFSVGFLLCWFTGGLFVCFTPFLWGKISDPPPRPLCLRVVMIDCLFFNFAEPFGFGCSSLIQEMTFIDHYLPYFRQWLITYPLCLFSVCLLTFQWRSSPCFSPSSPMCFQSSQPLCCVLVFSSLIIVQLFFFFFFFVVGSVNLLRGLWWFIPVVARGILCDAWSSPVCIPSRFGASVWQPQQPTYFLSVMWYGEAFYGLGVQGVKVLICFCVLFPPSVVPVPQQDFWFTELTLSDSAP
jgi:hypothetical protein